MYSIIKETATRDANSEATSCSNSCYIKDEESSPNPTLSLILEQLWMTTSYE